MNAAGRRRVENNGRPLPADARREGLRYQRENTGVSHRMRRFIMLGLLGHEGSTDRTDEEHARLLNLAQRLAQGVDRDELAARVDIQGLIPAYLLAFPRSLEACPCGWRGLSVPWIGCRACQTGWWALGVVP